MKLIILLLVLGLVVSCSESQVEELTFRKSLEYDLVGLCDDDKGCIKSVKSQTKQCMEKSEWRKFLENQDSQEELARFSKEFYSCIVDAEGKPYFESNL